MPGFSDNLRRAREAAGLSPEDLASRVGATPIWLAHLEALDAALPELPHLVRLAEALGCRIDDLLTGGDDDFDHPRRRHAALIAARLGRINTAQSRVNSARARGELTRLDELCLDEPSLLASVCRCRGWVTSPTSDIRIAAGLERELDDHLARLTDVMCRVDARADSVGARTLADLPAPTAARPSRTAGPAAGDVLALSGKAPAAPTARVQAGGQNLITADGANGPATAVPAKTAVILKGAVAASAVSGAAALQQLPSLSEAAPAAATRRRPGRRTAMWSRQAQGGDYVCEMVTQGSSVELVLLRGDRELAVHPCKSMDEAFTQSSKWKRIPDPEAHFAGSAA